MGIIKSIKDYFTGVEEEPAPNTGRNEPCWCGSGKKYKRCHIEADQQKRSSAYAASCTTT